MVEIMESGKAKESGEKIIDWTTRSLSKLKIETWVNKALNWLKSVFWSNDSSKKENNDNLVSNPSTIDTSDYSKTADPKESESNLNNCTNEHISDSVVKKARDYIVNGWTFHSNSLWTITWGWGKYKHVCSTWSYAVLEQLWIKNKSRSNECDLKWTILPKMWLEYIWEVDPDNPGKNWYKPQNGDTAVWPRFNNGRKMTQHQATFINWHWVSDTIQNKMSCYSSKNEPMVKVYRYTWKSVA